MSEPVAQPALLPYIFCPDCKAVVEYIRDSLRNAEDIVGKDCHHIICTFHEVKNVTQRTFTAYASAVAQRERPEGK